MNELIELAEKYGEVQQEELNLTDCVNFLESEGYQLFPLYLDFIKKYGGIKGCHSAYKDNLAKPKNFHTSPINAAKTAFMGWIKEYEDRIGCQLVIFGESSNGYIILMLGDNGKIYGGFDDLLYQYGDDISSGLDVLINGKELLEIN
ncbi:SUKH-3 domain-containing protein [Xenorhabdus bovienii]|uniref:SUKH-3 domain-containing protein n=1 Tax=Xenorhabdus bovienii TaxID=40576 RepID=UPI0023B31FF5|nr:SUKH-3 domain-containing protein [Xenorhabdus bovienii]MDE9534635.1 SUKH-3 domain-containing protein [Xenorhabdus bovienii]MDE9587863.1 SUKH-3 domain-containing protein [Xenorhabdus bovienii]